MPRTKSIPIILVDRRENLDYKFTGYKIPTFPVTLQTGDYSVGVQIIGDTQQQIIDSIEKKFGIEYTKNLWFEKYKNTESLFTIIRFDHDISVERKSLEDITSVISEKETRERFEASIKRGRLLKYYSVVIESSEMEVIMHQYTSEMLPQSVLNTAIRWSVKHHVPIIFCGSRIGAEYHTYESLMGFLEYKKRGLI